MAFFTEQTAFKQTAVELRAWRRAAAECEMPLQTWLRMVLDHAAGVGDSFEALESAARAHEQARSVAQAKIMREAREAKRRKKSASRQYAERRRMEE